MIRKLTFLTFAALLWSLPAWAQYQNIPTAVQANVNLTGTDTISLNASAAGTQKFTLTANETLTIQRGTLPITASTTLLWPFSFEICQNGTGNFTLAFAAGTNISAINWSGGGQPGYSLTANNGDKYLCTYNGTNLSCRLAMSNIPCE